MTGVVSLLAWPITVGAKGAVVSIFSSLAVVSVAVLPAASVTAAVTG